MGIFKGVVKNRVLEVTYDKNPLILKDELKIEKDKGFGQGNESIASRHLALAILSKVTSVENTLENYKDFTREFIKPLKTREWKIDEMDIRDWLHKHNATCKLPPINARFELKEYDGEYSVYLDDEKLGSHIEFPDRCNAITISEATCIYVYCDFSEIYDLMIVELPKNLVFDFINSDTSFDIEADMTEYLTLSKLHKVDGKTVIDFYFSIELDDYEKGDIKAILAKDNFIASLYKVEDITIEKEFYQDGYYWVFVSLSTIEKNILLKDLVYSKVDEMINLYQHAKIGLINKSFEFELNLPIEKQSSLKPHMAYFEKFINDLAKDMSDEDLLNKKPKNENEALKNIAMAIKNYLLKHSLERKNKVKEIEDEK